MWKPFAGVLATVLSVQASAAELPWTQQDIFHEISAEAAYCASYYGIVQHCVENSSADELAKRLDYMIDVASNVSTQFGIASGMTEEAMMAFTALAVGSLKGSIHNSCANLSVLILKYGETCMALLENPASRISVLQKGPPPDTPR